MADAPLNGLLALNSRHLAPNTVIIFDMGILGFFLAMRGLSETRGREDNSSSFIVSHFIPVDVIFYFPQRRREMALDSLTPQCSFSFILPALLCVCHVCDLSGNSLRFGTLACEKLVGQSIESQSLPAVTGIQSAADYSQGALQEPMLHFVGAEA